MIYLECPNRLPKINNGLFLAGGITGCPDWQSEMVGYLKDTDYTILNPRRKLPNIQGARQQIVWEFEYLRKAEKILFWFAAETVQPIALYELGAWAVTRKPLLVGVHPDYGRLEDIVIQLGLVRPDVFIVNSLKHLAIELGGSV